MCSCGAAANRGFFFRGKGDFGVEWYKRLCFLVNQFAGCEDLGVEFSAGVSGIVGEEGGVDDEAEFGREAVEEIAFGGGCRCLGGWGGHRSVLRQLVAQTCSILAAQGSVRSFVFRVSRERDLQEGAAVTCRNARRFTSFTCTARASLAPS